MEVITFVTWFAMTIASFGTLGVFGTFIVLPFAGVAAVVVHEIGHVAAALAVGWRVLLISVGPVGIHIPSGRPVFDRRLRLDDAAGWVMAVPGSLATDTRRRYIFYVLGGPLASLALTIAAIAALVGIDPGEQILGFPGWGIPTVTAALSFCAFLATIVPDGENNDASKVLSAWREYGQSEPGMAATWLGVMLDHKVRLRDLPRWAFDAARTEAESRPELQRALLSMEAGRTLDADEVDAGLARRQLDEYGARFGGDDWSNLCSAYLAAVHEGDIATAEEMLAHVEVPSALPRMHYAALAAVAMRKGDRSEAKLNLRLMKSQLNFESPYPDMTFRDIRREIEAIRPLPA